MLGRLGACLSSSRQVTYDCYFTLYAWSMYIMYAIEGFDALKDPHAIQSENRSQALNLMEYTFQVVNVT